MQHLLRSLFAQDQRRKIMDGEISPLGGLKIGMKLPAGHPTEHKNRTDTVKAGRAVALVLAVSATIR